MEKSGGCRYKTSAGLCPDARRHLRPVLAPVVPYFFPQCSRQPLCAYGPSGAASGPAVLGADRLLGGFSYRAEYLQRFATTASLLYTGYDYYGEDRLSSQYPAPMRRHWVNDLEVRLSQDLSFEAGGRLHTVQFTGSVRMASDLAPLSSDHLIPDDPFHPYGPSAILVGLRYLL